jgi:hypothetical protein
LLFIESAWGELKGAEEREIREEKRTALCKADSENVEQNKKTGETIQRLSHCSLRSQEESDKPSSMSTLFSSLDFSTSLVPTCPAG